MLAEQWWFWAAVGSARWRQSSQRSRDGAAAAAARPRRRPLGRRLVAEGAGLTIDRGGGGRWSEPWLPAFFVGLWVCASPWIWGYDDVDGAIAADVVTGGRDRGRVAGRRALSRPAGPQRPRGPVAHDRSVAGRLRDGSGPVGLSDTLAGIATSALALRRHDRRDQAPARSRSPARSGGCRAGAPR